MNTPIKQLAARHHSLIFFLLCAVVGYLLVTLIVAEKLEDTRTSIELSLERQQGLLVSIAETTARNGADTITESIVRDCTIPERSQFDTLLGRLDQGLSVSELTTLERLFARCGSFYSQRKSVMVSRFSREIEVYSSYVEQLKTVGTKKSVESYQIETWQKLADEEQAQSDQFSQLVGLQQEIIETLLSGKGPTSPEIQAILTKVTATQTALNASSQAAAAIRTELLPL